MTSRLGRSATAVRPARPNGHGAAWELLLAREEKIRAWVAGEGEQRPLTITKIGQSLARVGVYGDVQPAKAQR